MKVLLVDDNEKMRGMIKLYLNGFADEIIECDDGAEAIALYEKTLPDVVCMDIVMKHLDGISATQKIKQAHPDACVIIVSQYDDMSFRESARRAGAYGYVLKDNLTALLQLVGAATMVVHPQEGKKK
ncbi:MAG: response regulator transcription factor [Ignavibacteriae bacterium]|nr:response regulator transcription factor [Ignavibacteriota bacterium]